MARHKLESFLEAPPSNISVSQCILDYVENNAFDLPEDLLVQVWKSLTDDIHGCITGSRSIVSSNFSKIVELVEVLLNQCFNLSFDGFLEECMSGLVASISNKGLKFAVDHILSMREFVLGLICLYGKCERVAVFEESQRLHGAENAAKTWLLMKLLTGNGSELGGIFSGRRMFSEVPIIQAGFNLIIEMAQLSLLHHIQEPTYDSAWIFLQELAKLSEDKWMACYSAVLHKILSIYLKCGPTVTAGPSLKPLLSLLSSPTIATTFLDKITTCPELHGSVTRTVVNAAFQLFVLAYKEIPSLILTTCAAKLVTADTALLRLECLSVLARIRTEMSWKSDSFTWPSEVTKMVMTCVLRDTSVRVRRCAMQLLMQIEPNKSEEEEYVVGIFLKIRDEDDKIKSQALERLSKMSTSALAAYLNEDQWKCLFNTTLCTPYDSQSYDIGKKLLVEYVLCDEIEGSPSLKLGLVDFGGDGEFEMYQRALKPHIREVFERELSFLSQS